MQGVGDVITAPYPGFPTDAQPLLMAALLKSNGETRFRENIFEKRFSHARELCRLGADIEINGRLATVRGVKNLWGTEVTAADLRGGAAMLIAGLCAEGKTSVKDKGYICRGYESFDKKLRALGADIITEI